MTPVQNPEVLSGSVQEANEMNKMIKLASQPGYIHPEINQREFEDGHKVMEAAQKAKGLPVTTTT